MLVCVALLLAQRAEFQLPSVAERCIADSSLPAVHRAVAGPHWTHPVRSVCPYVALIFGQLFCLSSLHPILHWPVMCRYLAVFVDEGFDVPASLRTLTEKDLDAMQVKKGHKRAIMDAIKTIDHHVTVRFVLPFRVLLSCIMRLK